MTRSQWIACGLGMAALLAGRAGRAEPAVELEATLLGQGALYAGYGGIAWGQGGGVLLGLPLGERSVLMTGLQAQGGSGDGSFGSSNSRYQVSIPLLLKVYLRPPRAGRVVPLLRLGAAYSRAGGTVGGTTNGLTGEMTPIEMLSQEIQGLGSAGLAYFVTTNLAFAVEAGVRYTRSLTEQTDICTTGCRDWSLAATWQMALVLRI